MGKSKRGLTPRQEKYCQERAAGASYSAAYKAAGYSPTGSTATARKNAFSMENGPGVGKDILRRIEELKADAAAGATLDRAARMALLARIAMNDGARDADRVRAVDILCRAGGDYTDTADVRVTIATETERRDAWRAVLGADGAGET